jgi:hypothetical protein
MAQTIYNTLTKTIKENNWPGYIPATLEQIEASKSTRVLGEEFEMLQ